MNKKVGRVIVFTLKPYVPFFYDLFDMESRNTRNMMLVEGQRKSSFPQTTIFHFHPGKRKIKVYKYMAVS